MSISIPLIRAAAIAPMRRWLSENGWEEGPFLACADLAWVTDDDPLLPIPLKSAFRLLCEIGRAAGPDAPHRIVNGRGGFEIGLIGAEAFRGATPREGLHRIAQAMPYHCTHEVFTVRDRAGSVQVRDGWALALGDDEVLHSVQQYVASLVDMICSVASGSAPCVSSVSMVPHPQAGLAHLTPWLGGRVFAAKTRALDVTVENAEADRPFPPGIVAAQTSPRERPLERLRKRETLADDISILVTGMLPRTTPSLDQVAAASGLSDRTLRRRLQSEGTTFSEIVERSRAQMAIRRLRDDPALALKDLAKELGYSDQATLSRLVKRWTGKTPRDFAEAERRSWARADR